jgi:hypothetical protein
MKNMANRFSNLCSGILASLLLFSATGIAFADFAQADHLYGRFSGRLDKFFGDKLY